MKGSDMVLLTCALFIDGIQAASTWFFFAIGTGLQIATPIGGAAGGAIYCFSASTGNLIDKIADATACAGAGGILGAIGLPLGIGLGFVASVCLSATMGSGLLLMLKFNKSFYAKFLLPGAVVELIPGFGVLPTWTGITFGSIRQRVIDEKKAALQAAQANAQNQPQAQPDLPQQPRQMNDIVTPVPSAAANDNNVPSTQRYAA